MRVLISAIRLSFAALLLAGTSGCGVSFDLGSSAKPAMPVLVEPIGDLTLLDPDEIKPRADAIQPQSGVPSRGLNSQPLPVAGSAAEGSPFRMSVGQSFFKAGDLHLRVYLEALQDIPTDQVAVEAVGLHQGKVVSRDVKFLNQVLANPTVAATQSVIIPLTLSGEELSEYQIRGMWGDDARAKRPEGELGVEGLSSGSTKKETTANNTTTKPLGGNSADQAELSSVAAQHQPAEPETESDADSNHLAEKLLDPLQEISPGSEQPSLALLDFRTERKNIACDDKNCPQLLSVFGTIKNTGQAPLTNISLAVGLFWQEGRQSPVLPEPLSPVLANERAVGIPQQILMPGESRRIRLNIDREVPVIPGGSFEPHVRLLGAEILR